MCHCNTHTHTDTLSHTQPNSWKELGLLSLSLYSRDDNLHHSPSVIEEPFISTINNTAADLWANSFKDLKKTLAFRCKLSLVYCTGVWLLDSSSGVLCSNALLKILVSNTQDSQGSNMFFHTSYSLSLNLILLINNFSVTSVQRCADVDCQCPLANTSS